MSLPPAWLVILRLDWQCCAASPPVGTGTARSCCGILTAAGSQVSQPAISKHLKVLEQAGLISRTRRATARLSRLEAEPLREVTTWLARYQRFWDESHERLDDLLAALHAGHGDHPDHGQRAAAQPPAHRRPAQTAKGNADE